MTELKQVTRQLSTTENNLEKNNNNDNNNYNDFEPTLFFDFVSLTQKKREDSNRNSFAMHRTCPF